MTYEGKNKGDSAFGVVDMAGNVWEWCLSEYDNPKSNEIANSNMRVLRGGSWFDVSSNGFRAAYRGRVVPNYGSFSFGFRVSSSY